MKKQHKELLRFLSFTDKMSPEHKSTFLALYVAFGDDLLFLFHTLRGQRIVFPASRTFKRVSRQIQAGEYKVVDSKDFLFSESGERLDIQYLLIGQTVLNEGIEYVVSTAPVRLCSTYFATLSRKGL